MYSAVVQYSTTYVWMTDRTAKSCRSRLEKKISFQLCYFINRLVKQDYLLLSMAIKKNLFKAAVKVLG